MASGRFLAAALLALFPACAISGGVAGGLANVELQDVDGRAHRPLDARGRANVVVFTTVDCPIANGYAPEIQRLADEFEPEGVRFHLVHVDPDVDATRAAAHAREFGYRMPVLLDPTHTLVRELGATITPEAAVIRADGTVVYRGRIDDQWADLGVKRRAPRYRDLEDVLRAVVAGKDLPRTRTPAVGCFIPDLPVPR